MEINGVPVSWIAVALTLLVIVAIMALSLARIAPVA